MSNVWMIVVHLARAIIMAVLNAKKPSTQPQPAILALTNSAKPATKQAASSARNHSLRLQIAHRVPVQMQTVPLVIRWVVYHAQRAQAVVRLEDTSKTVYVLHAAPIALNVTSQAV